MSGILPYKSLKAVFSKFVFSHSEWWFYTAVVPTYITLYSRIPNNIVKVCPEGFADISFLAWFISHFKPKNKAEIIFFKGIGSIFWFTG